MGKRGKISGESIVKKRNKATAKYPSNRVRFSIKNKILLLVSMAAIPFLILALCILISMSRYNRTYDEIVDNLTVANSYNISFKEEMDESLYKIVVGYTTFETIAEENELKDPYILIKDLRNRFTELEKVTIDEESAIWLASLLRNLDTLEERVDDIVENVEAGGHYEENIKELDNNIYILTELIQDDIQYYIYYQTQSMDTVSNRLNHQIRVFAIISTVLLIFFSIVVITLVIWAVTRILTPIQSLYCAAEKIAEGDFEVRVNTDSNDELAVLSQGFNDMAGNIEILVGQIREDEQKMRRADLRLLQEQINPHFLYNTLDNIVWLIEANSPEQAVEMVITLSDFFRVVLSKGKEFISIKQEEQHIRSYLKIQEKRYHDILEYDIQIDPVLYDYQILKLTLQPLVENALYHGIKYKRAKGYIHIYGEKEDGLIRLIVRDSGVGMEKAELEQLRKEITQPCQETEKGFGLANVNERIKMYFGAEYGMQIDSEKGKGTTCVITIPAIRIDEKQSERSRG
ncbi:sensor histidine kinase [Faecalicatena sp. AGMB00832]|uniref:Sensor histidine kinase n=1 Tax=Faecalicatena faecalis TaxID=2726362 RepID=A0ABS6D7D1_9FIRM|nr:sensor histidine kinase [Faecalicatena faecalis]